MHKTLFLPFVLLIALVGCESLDLTPKQRVFDLASKYEAVQIVAEQAVLNANTPADVKAGIKIGDATALTALKDYRAAVERDDPNTGAFLSAGLSAINQLTALLVANGFLEINQ